MVKAIERSANAKTGEVSATYAAQGSCPTDCVFLGSGCYAESGNTGIHTHGLNKLAGKATALEIARSEARAIDTLSGERPLRLHVVGDCRTNQAAKLVSGAARRFVAKAGQMVWTYTHAWRKVKRESWNGVSVLASCETTQQVREASKKGYKTALVVDRFRDTRAYYADGVKIVPCPQQTGRAENCRACKLCLTGQFDGTIGFEAHGSRANTVKRHLIQLGGSSA